MRQNIGKGKKSAMRINSPSWIYHLKSLSCLIPILHRNPSNLVVGNALVNKFARLSFEWICRTSMSPHFSRSYVKKNFGEICFVLSPLMYPPFNWVIYAILSSYSMVRVPLLKDKPHVLRICWVIDLNWLHGLQVFQYLLYRSPWYSSITTRKEITCLRSIFIWIR